MNSIVLAVLLLAATRQQGDTEKLPKIAFQKQAAGYMQFPTYAQVRYPDGRLRVFAPYEKIWNSEPIESVRISNKYKNGATP